MISRLKTFVKRPLEVSAWQMTKENVEIGIPPEFEHFVEIGQLEFDLSDPNSPKAVVQNWLEDDDGETFVLLNDWIFIFDNGLEAADVERFNFLFEEKKYD